MAGMGGPKDTSNYDTPLIPVLPTSPLYIAPTGSNRATINPLGGAYDTSNYQPPILTSTATSATGSAVVPPAPPVPPVPPVPPLSTLDAKQLDGYAFI